MEAPRADRRQAGGGDREVAQARGSGERENVYYDQ